MAVFKSKSLGPETVQNLDMTCRVPGMSQQHSGDKLNRISIMAWMNIHTTMGLKIVINVVMSVQVSFISKGVLTLNLGEKNCCFQGSLNFGIAEKD